MNGRRAVIGLFMLCALLVSALAAQGAMAKNFGTTAWTCKAKSPEGGAGFSKEHCKPSDAVTTAAKYEHDDLPVGRHIELSATNAKTNEATTGPVPMILKSTRAGVAIEFEAAGIATLGGAFIENATRANAGGEKEMYAESRATIRFTGVIMKKPAANGCKVFSTENAGPPVTHAGEGEILTDELLATTEGQPKPAEEMFVNFKPAVAPTLAEFYLTECAVKSLNGTYLVTGSVKGRPEGATTNFTLADTKAQGTLRLGGQVAELEGKITSSARETNVEPFDPIGPTTSENT